MVYLFTFLGIAFIGLAFWREKYRDLLRQRDMEEYRELNKDMRQTKEDVQQLMDELASVSEKVIEEINAGLEKAEALEEKAGAMEEKAENMAETPVTGKSESSKGSGLILHEKEPAEIRRMVIRDKKEEKTNRIAGTKNKTIIFPNNSEKPGAPKDKSQKPVLETEIPAKQQMVYAMDRLGYPEEEIARQMNIGKGEVRLILRLKRKGEELNA